MVYNTQNYWVFRLCPLMDEVRKPSNLSINCYPVFVLKTFIIIGRISWYMRTKQYIIITVTQHCHCPLHSYITQLHELLFHPLIYNVALYGFTCRLQFLCMSDSQNWALNYDKLLWSWVSEHWTFWKVFSCLVSYFTSILINFIVLYKEVIQLPGDPFHLLSNLIQIFWLMYGAGWRIVIPRFPIGLHFPT
jgi:hypothetical protein